ncbi:MAG: hypothetical protein KDC87_13840 [Planctomycetes bacterium]|nr:hypothetical protein [Planctomycetota bacterium]MCB9872011.1 hypothetical protein [Planctomycetota bacterium]MCB9888415.1 hypothetical protein [Planctomycetota bacterium]
MVEQTQRELVHKVNNLIGVILTQAEVARAAGDLAAARSALEFITRAAEATIPFVRAVQAEQAAD